MINSPKIVNGDQDSYGTLQKPMSWLKANRDMVFVLLDDAFKASHREATFACVFLMVHFTTLGCRWGRF